MYAISDAYKAYINSSLSRIPKSKVVIDGVDYTDNVLMSVPSISHTNETFIGGFPSKTVTFEIRDELGSLELNDKWIEVYRGLEIAGTVEYMPVGIFKALNAEDITINKTKKTISFKGYDKRQLLDVAYESRLDWTTSHTGLEIVQDVLTGTGLELHSTSFNFSSFVFSQSPNFPSGITKTEAISRMAEIGGEIAIITREGKVHIKSPEATNVTFGKGKRSTLSKNKKFGAITTLVLGNEGYDDDVIYKAKNLFDKNGIQVVNNGVTLSPTETGVRATTTIAGSYLFGGFLLPLDRLIGETFKVSGTITPSASNNGSMALYWLDSDYGLLDVVIPTGDNVYTIESVPSNASHLSILLYGNLDGTSSVGDYVEYSNLQVEIGSESTEYEDFISAEETEWRIEDNPYVELIRQDIITAIKPFILGRSIIPFELGDAIDDFYLDLNDAITIEDADGSIFTSTILSYDTASRIKSNIKASAQNETLSNYNIAGGVKKSINDVKLEVNHMTNQITSLVKTTNDLTTTSSETVQNAESVTTTFYEEVIKGQIEGLSESLNKEIETRSSAVRTSMDDEGNIVVELGSSSSPYTLETKNDGLYIYQNGELLQYLQGNFANIPNLKVEDTMQLYPLLIKKSATGKIRGVRAGDG